jgi:hypothetical protein
MNSLKISKKHIVTLWHETQMGSMKRCNKAQEEFAEMMWELYDDMQPEVFDADKDCFSYHEEQDNKAMKKERNE